ncbi:aminotransferase-like domain-containing protein [Aquibacillus kalidii]|uniref:aminotransferase-like domain-containing protein n=1 Tax=Aquibacillus kalidii TaxID=2762597 RepID=UPI002E27B229|nr:PLP-dependent aminotransferase family protein [Aquibacillus kalidii]
MGQILQIDNEQSLSFGYMEPKGSLSLRETISTYLRTKGIEASSESISTVSGGLLALQLISIGLLNRGSTFLHETPSYLNLVHVFQSAGMNLMGLPIDKEGIKFDAIERMKRQHYASLFYTIPTFYNSTGKLMSEKRRLELIEVCQKETTIPIIEDDVYGDLWFENPPPKPLKAKDTQGNVLYIGSVSNTLSPGLRISWIVGPEPVIERLADIKMQTDYGSSSLSQYAVDKWLCSGMYDDFLKEIREELKFRMDFTILILKKYFSEIATCSTPKGSFYIWINLLSCVSNRKVFNVVLREGILLNPGSVYDNNDLQHLRISYSYASMEQLEKGLISLAKLIKSLL